MKQHKFLFAAARHLESGERRLGCPIAGAFTQRKPLFAFGVLKSNVG
ncbi:hypothetical protein LC040_02685 [Bacillus tianshenii]|nr:hypothetical protein LC040_02685 [Bacillus tianshenii]